MRFDLPPPLRTPLLFCTLCWLFSAGLALWSWQRAAQAASQLDRLRKEISASERQLSELRQALQSAEQAQRLLADIQMLEVTQPSQPAAPHATAEARWREYPAPLESTFVHEEALLSRIADWQARSPIQHQLRGCRLTRAEDGMFASCQLVALEMQQ